MLARIGELAQELGKEYIDLTYIATARNQPARDFILAIAPDDQKITGDQISRRLSAEIVATVNYDPGQNVTEPALAGLSDARIAPAMGSATVAIANPVSAKAGLLINRIAQHLRTVDEIAMAIAERRRA